MSNKLPTPDEILGGGNNALPSPQDILGVEKKSPSETTSAPSSNGVESTSQSISPSTLPLQSGNVAPFGVQQENVNGQTIATGAPNVQPPQDEQIRQGASIRAGLFGEPKPTTLSPESQQRASTLQKGTQAIFQKFPELYNDPKNRDAYYNRLAERGVSPDIINAIKGDDIDTHSLGVGGLMGGASYRMNPVTQKPQVKDLGEAIPVFHRYEQSVANEIKGGAQKMQEAGAMFEEDPFSGKALFHGLVGAGEMVLGGATVVNPEIATFTTAINEASNASPVIAKMQEAPIVSKFIDDAKAKYTDIKLKPPAWLDDTKSVADFLWGAFVFHHAGKLIGEVRNPSLGETTKGDVKIAPDIIEMEKELNKLTPDQISAIYNQTVEPKNAWYKHQGEDGNNKSFADWATDIQKKNQANKIDIDEGDKKSLSNALARKVVPAHFNQLDDLNNYSPVNQLPVGLSVSYKGEDGYIIRDPQTQEVVFANKDGKQTIIGGGGDATPINDKGLVITEGKTNYKGKQYFAEKTEDGHAVYEVKQDGSLKPVHEGDKANLEKREAIISRALDNQVADLTTKAAKIKADAEANPNIVGATLEDAHAQVHAQIQALHDQAVAMHVADAHDDVAMQKLVDAKKEIELKLPELNDESKQALQPEIEKINNHIKALQDAIDERKKSKDDQPQHIGANGQLPAEEVVGDKPSQEPGAGAPAGSGNSPVAGEVQQEVKPVTKKVKPESPELSDKQQKGNKLLDMISSFNALKEGHLGKDTKEGRELRNKIDLLGAELGHDFSGTPKSRGVRVPKNLKRALLEEEKGRGIAKEFKPVAERSTPIQKLANDILDLHDEGVPVLNGLEVNRPDGKAMSNKELAKALTDLREGKNTNNAKAVLDALEKMHDADAFDFIDPSTRERHPLTREEFLQGIEDSKNALEEAKDAIAAGPQNVLDDMAHIPPDIAQLIVANDIPPDIANLIINNDIHTFDDAERLRGFTLTDKEADAIQKYFPEDTDATAGDGLSETEEANRRKAEAEYNDQLADLDKRISDAKKERQNKLDSINNKVDLFAGQGKKDVLFEEAQVQTPEQVAKILQPLDDKISALEKEKDDFIDNKDAFLDKYKGQQEIEPEPKQLSKKEQALKDLADARDAFKKAGGLSSGGLESLPEFINLVKAYIKAGYATAQEFIDKFREDHPSVKIEDGQLRDAFEEQKKSDENVKNSPLNDFLEKTKVGIVDFKNSIAKNVQMVANHIQSTALKSFKMLSDLPKEFHDPLLQENVYHHMEDPSLPLTEREKEFRDKYVIPLKNAVTELYERIKNTDVDAGTGLWNEIKNYLPRQVMGKPMTMERLIKGAKKIASGSALKTGDASLKHRLYNSLTDSDGNRIIVKRENGKFVQYEDGKPVRVLGDVKKAEDTVTEYHDKAAVDALKQTADNLGIDHQRVLTLGGEKLGVSQKGGGIKTRAATPMSVLIHEIGHQVDDRFGLQDQFIKNGGKEIREELRKLSDLRNEGEVTESRLRYTRKGAEKMAVMFEAYLQTPEAFKAVAPKTWEKFNDFLNSHPELKPIVDFKPSLHFKEMTTGHIPEKGIFVDKDGNKYSIGDATVKEIEDKTPTRYYKTPFANLLIAYNNLSKVNVAQQFLESFKNSPEFDKVAVDLSKTTDVPDGWRTSDLPQFRNYAFDPKTAAELNRLHKDMKLDPLSFLTKANTLFRNAIVFGVGVKHWFNETDLWLKQGGVSRFVNPYRLGKSGMDAMHALVTQSPEYFKVLERGGSLMMRDASGASAKMLQVAAQQIAGDKTTMQKISSALGYANPLTLVKALSTFSHKSAFAAHDFFTLQAIFEDMAKGHSMDESIDRVQKFIPDYRIPSTVFGSEVASKALRNPNLTMFSNYHYSLFKAYGNMFKDLGKALTSSKMSVAERAEAVDHLAAAAVVQAFLYPALTYAYQQATGDKEKKVVEAGSSKLGKDIYQLTEGQKTFGQFLYNYMTPAQGTESLVELSADKNLSPYKTFGDPIYTPTDITQNPKEAGKDIGKFMLNKFSPTQKVQAVESGQTTVKDIIEDQLLNAQKVKTGEQKVFDQLLYQKGAVDDKASKLKRDGKILESFKMKHEYNQKLIEAAKALMKTKAQNKTESRAISKLKP